jgi:hypothetical protein
VWMILVDMHPEEGERRKEEKRGEKKEEFRI